jgi:hypothetical protein
MLGFYGDVRKMSAATFVYVISGDHGRQKIGVSDDPRQRIRDLQTGSPFKLKFEFIGQTDGTGFDIEGEAHFLLHAHRAEGEWFVVPPEVAITAVMASARRLNHTIRPVDIDNMPGLAAIGPPMWQKWLKGALVIAAFYPMILLLIRFDRGELPAGALLIEAAFLLLGVKIAQWLAVKVALAWLEFLDFIYQRKSA